MSRSLESLRIPSLRDLCGQEYGEEFLEVYDAVGDLNETARVLEAIEYVRVKRKVLAEDRFGYLWCLSGVAACLIGAIAICLCLSMEPMGIFNVCLLLLGSMLCGVGIGIYGVSLARKREVGSR